MLGGAAVLKRAIRGVLRPLGYDMVSYTRPIGYTEKEPAVRSEFQNVQFAAAALQKLIDDFTFETVLDIGCGSGAHSEAFRRHGKKVTALDYGKSVYFEKAPSDLVALIGDFNEMQFDQQYHCVWASHVLEHQLNVSLFLKKVFSLTKEGGVICITVPPLQREILGGHVTVWNAGLLLYNLVLAGFDCHNASILRYGCNISLIVPKKTACLPELAFDKGDVDRISSFLPEGFQENFNGDIWSLNW
jgi:SAM-dependent methyltransferase